MISKVNNNQPSFGMALKKPADMEAFSKFIGTRRGAVRGLKQFVKEQKNVLSDIEYHAQEKTISVSKYGTYHSMTCLPANKQTRFSQKYTTLMEKNDKAGTFKKLLTVARVGIGYLKSLMFSPKDFLPVSLLEAGKIAKQEAQNGIAAAKKEVKHRQKTIKNRENIEKLFS